MATAQIVIDKALTKLGVKMLGVAATAQQYTDAIETLNDMLAELDIEGIKFGYSIVAAKEDEMTVPDFTLSFLKTRLAIKLASEYQISPTEILLGEADAAASAIDKYLTRKDRTEVSYPDILPLGGSGGDYDYPIFATDIYRNAVTDGTGAFVNNDEGCLVTDESGESVS